MLKSNPAAGKNEPGGSIIATASGAYRPILVILLPIH